MWTLLLTLAHGCEPGTYLAADGRCSRARLAWALPPDWKVEHILHPEPDLLWLVRIDPEHRIGWYALDLVGGGLTALETPTKPFWPVPFAGGVLARSPNQLFRWSDGGWQTSPLPEDTGRLVSDGDGLLTRVGREVRAWDGETWAVLGSVPGEESIEHLFRVDGALHACTTRCQVLTEDGWAEGPVVPEDAWKVSTSADGFTWARGGGSVWQLRAGAFEQLTTPTAYGSGHLTPWGLHYAGDGKLFVHDGTDWQLREGADYAHERTGPDDWVSLDGTVHVAGSHPFGVDTSTIAVAPVPTGGLLISGDRGIVHLDRAGQLHAVERPSSSELEVAVLGDGTWVAYQPQTLAVWIRRDRRWESGPDLPGAVPRRGRIEPRIFGVAGDRLVLAREGTEVVHWSPSEPAWTVEQAPFAVGDLHGIDAGVWVFGTGGQTAVFAAPGRWTTSVDFEIAFERRGVLQLRNGEVLVVGGEHPGARTGTVGTALCRPLQGTCRPAPSLPTEVDGGALVELTDGRVVLLGGDRSRVHWLEAPLDRVPPPVDTRSLDWLQVSPFAWDSIRVLEPSRWVEGAPLREKGAHRHGASVLADGRIAVLGGGLGAPLQFYDPGGDVSPAPPLPRDRVRDLTEAYCLAGHSGACATLPEAVRGELTERFR